MSTFSVYVANKDESTKEKAKKMADAKKSADAVSRSLAKAKEELKIADAAQAADQKTEQIAEMSKERSLSKKKLMQEGPLKGQQTAVKNLEEAVQKSQSSEKTAKNRMKEMLEKTTSKAGELVETSKQNAARESIKKKEAAVKEDWTESSWKRKLVSDEVSERDTKKERNNKYHNEIDAKRKKEDVDKTRARKTSMDERVSKTQDEKVAKAGQEMDATEKLAKAKREVESKNHLMEMTRFSKEVSEVTGKKNVREVLSKKGKVVKDQISLVSDQLQKEERKKKDAKVPKLPPVNLVQEDSGKKEKAEKEKYAKQMKKPSPCAMNLDDPAAREKCMKTKLSEQDAKLAKRKASKKTNDDDYEIDPASGTPLHPEDSPMHPEWNQLVW
jgi:hypothetical protein